MGDLVLYLTVIAGRNLAAKDDNGLSDPFCVVRLSTGHTKKTRVIKKTLNPTWNQELSLGKVNASSKLKLTCWDHDTFSSDDFMGLILMDIGSRAREGAWTEWITLSDGGKSDEVSGDLHLTFSIESKDKSKSRKNATPTPAPVPMLTSAQSLPDLSQSYRPNVKLFGVELSVLEKRCGGIPPPVLALLDRLDADAPTTVGIFRIAGVHTTMQECKHRLNSGESVDFGSEDIHDVAGVLKMFLRELPTPILTYTLYEKVIASGLLQTDQDEALEVLKECVKALPKINHDLLKRMVELMHHITTNSAVNKMSTNNLVICISPNLLWTPPQRLAESNALEDMQNVSGATRMLVQQKDYIFKYVPKEREPDAPPREELVDPLDAESRRLFETYDFNGDGTMDRGEFSVFYRDTLVSLGMPEPSESDIDEAIQVLDKDKNNEIDYKEFSDWWRMMHGATQRRRARTATGRRRVAVPAPSGASSSTSAAERNRSATSPCRPGQRGGAARGGGRGWGARGGARGRGALPTGPAPPRPPRADE